MIVTRDNAAKWPATNNINSSRKGKKERLRSFVTNIAREDTRERKKEMKRTNRKNRENESEKTEKSEQGGRATIKHKSSLYEYSRGTVKITSLEEIDRHFLPSFVVLMPPFQARLMQMHTASSPPFNRLPFNLLPLSRGNPVRRLEHACTRAILHHHPPR